MTYGRGTAGYDVRVEFEEGLTRKAIPSGSFILASTIEEFTMPCDIIGIVHDKSTWARLGLAVQNTVIEPGWCGFLTLELTNHGPDKLMIKSGMPIAQIIFHQVDEMTDGYEGKYQNQQRHPVEAILEEN